MIICAAASRPAIEGVDSPEESWDVLRAEGFRRKGDGVRRNPEANKDSQVSDGLTRHSFSRLVILLVLDERTFNVQQ